MEQNESYYYKIGGLVFKTNFELKNFTPCFSNDSIFHEIQLVEKIELSYNDDNKIFSEQTETSFKYGIPGFLNAYIKNDKISFLQNIKSDSSFLETFIHEVLLKKIFHFNQVIVLNGIGLIDSDSKLTLITGEKSNGKTTLGLLLAKKNYEIIFDDYGILDSDLKVHQVKNSINVPINFNKISNVFSKKSILIKSQNLNTFKKGIQLNQIYFLNSKIENKKSSINKLDKSKSFKYLNENLIVPNQSKSLLPIIFKLNQKILENITCYESFNFIKSKNKFFNSEFVSLFVKKEKI